MLLLRHASAGKRGTAPAKERARSLDRVGRADARELPAALAAHEIDRIVSSPHTRCLETVGPLARSLGLEIECREELAPDASRRDATALVDGLPATALVCTHREVIERLFEGELTCDKGGSWLLERAGRRLVPVAYLPPPSSAIPQRRPAVLG